MTYRRYSIPARPAPNQAAHPSRFKVKVDRARLAQLLLREMIHYRGDLSVVLSRPCVYGVFSGPVGGFAPRESLCVGCLRCTIEHPEIVQILPNPERLELGDGYFTPDQVDTVLYEAASGRVPVRGAGYAGGFGGPGWDGLWTDMSEIVRPTRDGIHGREYISTSVDLGAKPRYLRFDGEGQLASEPPHVISLPIPILFDLPPTGAPQQVAQTLLQACETLDTLAIVPAESVSEVRSPALVPLVNPEELDLLPTAVDTAPMIELAGWGPASYAALQERAPESLIVLRFPFGADLLPAVEGGAHTFHLTADFHGGVDGGFVLEAIRATHDTLVGAGVREQVTLIGSGGIIAAEHVAKAIVCGLDAVAIDTAAWIALQARFLGEFKARSSGVIQFPEFDPDWGVQRLVNLIASWRDQLLEVLGAMGLREVRRLRGEIGRSMTQAELEAEAFADIPRLEVTGG